MDTKGLAAAKQPHLKGCGRTLQQKDQPQRQAKGQPSLRLGGGQPCGDTAKQNRQHDKASRDQQLGRSQQGRHCPSQPERLPAVLLGGGLRAVRKADGDAGEAGLKLPAGQDQAPFLRGVHVDPPAPHSGYHHKGAKTPVGDQRHRRLAELVKGHLIALGIEALGLGCRHKIGGTGNGPLHQLPHYCGLSVIGQHHCQRCRSIFRRARLQDQFHAADGLTMFHPLHLLS